MFQNFVLLYSDCPLTLKSPRIWKMSIGPTKYYFYVLAQISICLHKYIPYVEYLFYQLYIQTLYCNVKYSSLIFVRHYCVDFMIINTLSFLVLILISTIRLI
jgi:hypothetical protein